MGKRNGSLIGKKNVGAATTATYNASGVWGLNDTQRVMGEDNSSTLKSKIQIQYLLVGGGGGGGGSKIPNIRGGGGGGGGMKEGTLILDSGTQLYVKVGEGGSGGNNQYPGGTGQYSRLATPQVEINGWGGGHGNGYNSAPDNDKWGASGGGLNNYAGAGAQAHIGYVNQGNPGGQLFTGNQTDYPSSNQSAAGGGGAGDKGEDAGSAYGGNGGIGKQSYITGTGVYYAGGGGGGARDGHNRGMGGAGGGGNGGVAPPGSSPGFEDGYNGQVNTGGGGGGAATGSNGQNSSSGTGGDGGRGIVILRYPNSIVWSGGLGLTYGSHTPIPGTDERYIQFTQGTGNITIVTQ